MTDAVSSVALRTLERLLLLHFYAFNHTEGAVSPLKAPTRHAAGLNVSEHHSSSEAFKYQLPYIQGCADIRLRD